MMMMSEKRQRLWEIMNELHGGVKKRKDDRASLNILHSRDSVVHYHGLYVDASRERFYLPKKWQLSGDGAGNWQECGVDYLFNKDEMNGTNLIQNLHWLGCSNQVLNLANKNSDDDQMNDSDDDAEDNNNTIEDVLIGRGISNHRDKRKRHHNRFEDDCCL